MNKPKRNRILVVEDDAITREIIVQLLQMAGYDVLWAETGERALVTLRTWRGQIDWLFTDVRLPGLVDGWIVADEFRMSHPLRPVVYASAHAADEARQVANSVFVRKPVSPVEVLATLKRLIGECDVEISGLWAPKPRDATPTPPPEEAAFADTRRARAAVALSG